MPPKVCQVEKCHCLWTTAPLIPKICRLSAECKICVIIHQWLCTVAEKDVSFSCYMSGIMSFPHITFPIGEQFDDHEGSSSSGKEEEGDEHGLEQLRSFAEVHAAKKLLKHSLHA